ncbi:hypothetical protein [Lacticaseibacillus sp. 866-1]|uniref:hypothetical protein n=1 Tax=Lacticaseibacillus sp. 866-1 TaxID=2799576 RepID=UPI00194154BC|nr:hypothetical protein [Lacticaseibacillus sp. 866-1]
MRDYPAELTEHDKDLIKQLHAKAPELKALGYTVQDDLVRQYLVQLDYADGTALITLDDMKSMLDLHGNQLRAWLVSRSAPKGVVYYL